MGGPMHTSPGVRDVGHALPRFDGGGLLLDLPSTVCLDHMRALDTFGAPRLLRSQRGISERMRGASLSEELLLEFFLERLAVLPHAARRGFQRVEAAACEQLTGARGLITIRDKVRSVLLEVRSEEGWGARGQSCEQIVSERSLLAPPLPFRAPV